MNKNNTKQFLYKIITIVKQRIVLLFNILIFYKVIDKNTYSIQIKLISVGMKKGKYKRLI